MQVKCEPGEVQILLDQDGGYKFFALINIETRKVVFFIEKDPICQEAEENLGIEMLSIQMSEQQYHKLLYLLSGKVDLGYRSSEGYYYP
jgi:hypothetical protein